MRFLGSVVLAFSLLAGAAAEAATYKEALERAGMELASAMARANLSPGAAVGIAKFRDQVFKVACEPLSALLTDGLRGALIRSRDQFALEFKVVEETDPRIVRVVAAGEWLRHGGRKVVLSLKMGDVKSKALRDIEAGNVVFDETSLPPEARACLLEFEPVDERLEVGRSLLVRAAPKATAAKIEELAPGSKVWSTARVKGTSWSVVRLADDETLPVGARERRGFVYADVGPDEFAPLIGKVEEVRREIEAHRSKLEAPRREVARLERAADEVRKTLITREAEVANAEDVYEKALDLHRPQRTEVTKAAVEEADTVLGVAERARDSARSELAKLERRLKDARAELKRAEAQGEELSAKLAAAERTLTKARFERLRREIGKRRTVEGYGKVTCEPRWTIQACEEKVLEATREDAARRGMALAVEFLRTIPNLGFAEADLEAWVQIGVVDEEAVEKEATGSGSYALRIKAVVTGTLPEDLLESFLEDEKAWSRDDWVYQPVDEVAFQ